MSFDKDRVVSGLICESDLCKLREAVCVDVEKVYDSCKEKDCIKDTRVFFKHPEWVQKLVNKAINVKAKDAEVLDVFADTEPVPFKKGFYTVDVKFFIKVTLDFFLPKKDFSAKSKTIHGLVLFDKKIILFGSEGNIKTFKSINNDDEIHDIINSTLDSDNEPIAKIEVAKPIALNARIVEECDECCCWCECAPVCVVDKLGDESDSDCDKDLYCDDDDKCVNKRVVVSLGLFSIIKLLRDVQLLIPAFDFCVPHKKCIASTDDDPCKIFETLDFPLDEFFPPQKFDFPGALEQEKKMNEVFEHECCKD